MYSYELSMHVSGKIFPKKKEADAEEKVETASDVKLVHKKDLDNDLYDEQNMKIWWKVPMHVLCVSILPFVVKRIWKNIYWSDTSVENVVNSIWQVDFTIYSIEDYFLTDDSCLIKARSNEKNEHNNYYEVLLGKWNCIFGNQLVRGE